MLENGFTVQWVLFMFQVLAVFAVVFARLGYMGWKPNWTMAFCLVLFLAVGAGTASALFIGHGQALFSGMTLAIMAIGMTLDLKGSSQLL